MSSDEDFEPDQPVINQPELELPIVIQDGWKFIPTSRAILKGACAEITQCRSKKECCRVYSGFVHGNTAEYRRVEEDRASRIDLTVAFINTRHSPFYSLSNYPNDMQSNPVVCKALVILYPDMYGRMSKEMKSNPDIVMTVVESIMADPSNRYVSNNFPIGLGRSEKLLTAIVDLVKSTMHKSSGRPFDLIWSVLFPKAPASHAEAMELYDRLTSWFKPVMFTALDMLILHCTDNNALACTIKLFDTATELGLPTHVTQTFVETRYQLIIKFVNAVSPVIDTQYRGTHIGSWIKIVDACKNDIPLMSFIAYYRPHQTAAFLLNLTISREDSFKVLDAAFKPGSVDRDANVVFKMFPNEAEAIGRRKPECGEFCSMMVQFQTTAARNAQFVAWATPEKFGHFLTRLMRPGHGSHGDRPSDAIIWLGKRPNCPGGLDAFKWNLLPTAWTDNPEFTRRLLAEVDPSMVTEIVRAWATPLFTLKTVITAEGEKQWYNDKASLTKDHDVVPSIHYTILKGSTDTFPWANHGMAVAFQDPTFEYLKNVNQCANSFLIRKPRSMAEIMALALLAHSSDIETCKVLIASDVLKVWGPTLTSIIPDVVMNQIRGDTAFWKSIFRTYECIGPTLPKEIRYKEEFLRLTVYYHPSAMVRYDHACIMQQPAMVELCLNENETIEWIYSKMTPEARGEAALVKEIMKNENLSMETRGKVFKTWVPVSTKVERWCQKLSIQMFGTVLGLRESDRAIDQGQGGPCEVLTLISNDPVIAKLLSIAHDSHSSNEATRGTNTAFLRSLHVDLQIAFMPEKIAKVLKIVAPNPSRIKTYTPALPESIMQPESRLENLKHEDLMKRFDWIEEVTNTASEILEPRRRDGGYPTNYYCENYEGLLVKFGWEDEPVESTDLGITHRKRALRTVSGKNAVKLPPSWLADLDGMQTEADCFWGKLFCGYGQHAKAVKLKNGTLGSVGDEATDAERANAAAEWEGVSIKVYGTFAWDAKGCGDSIFVHEDYDEMLDEFPPFVDIVDLFRVGGPNSENMILDTHRTSVASGGLGVVFREYSKPDKFITLDAAGYSINVQKIVDFLTKYPLQVLSAYKHAHCDEDDNLLVDEDDMEVVGERFGAISAKVACQMAPPPPPRKARVGKVRIVTKKSRLAPSGASCSTATATAASYWLDDSSSDSD